MKGFSDAVAKDPAFDKTAAFLRRHFGPARLALGVAVWVLALGVWGTFARTVLPMEYAGGGDLKRLRGQPRTRRCLLSAKSGRLHCG